MADLSLPGEISVEALQARHSFLNLVDERYRQMEAAANFGMVDAFDERALSLITSPTVRKAFDLSLESTKTKETYGTDRFGQGVLLARRLVEAGCRFVTVDGWNPADGHNWDTHYKNDHYLRNVLVPPLDRSLSALMEDLDQRGPAGIHRRSGDGRVRPHAQHQPGAGPRPLGPLLVSGAGRRRHQGRAR